MGVFLSINLEETVSHIACVHIVSRHSSRRVAAVGYGALVGASARARNIESGNLAALAAQEAVIDIAVVQVLPHNVSSHVDVPGVSTLAGASTRTGNVHINNVAIAVTSAHKAVTHIAGVCVLSRDCSSRINTCRHSALVGPSARAGSVEGRDFAVRCAHVAVKQIARVAVVSRHCPPRVETIEESREGALRGTRTRAGSVEGRDFAVRWGT